MSRRTHIKDKTWWIEYVEDEMSDSTKEAIELLLRHSLTDKMIVTNFRLLRKNIKESDPAKEFEAHIENDDNMKALNKKIMSEVEKTKMKKKSKWQDFKTRKLSFI